MSIVSYAPTPSLGQTIFGQTNLGDARRTARLIRTFDVMHRHPGGTLPDKLSKPADLRAFYRLCDCEKVTHAVVIAAAREHTLARINASSEPVLIIHDATELDYTSLTSLASQLGQIGRGTHRGYICHNSIAVAADSGEVLGLLDQTLHHRVKVKQETLAEHRARESRESLLWLRSTQHAPQQTIQVSDQGSDTFEYLEHLDRGQRSFVVRACKARKVSLGHQPQTLGPDDQQTPPYEMHAASQLLPELGRLIMDVQPQPGRVERKNAEFVMRGGAVLIHPPHAKSGQHGDDPLALWMVQVTEVAPPAGQAAIDWTLLTNASVSTLADAQRIVDWYKLRWTVEEYHKAQKTGCGIESLQFCTTARLEPAIALLSIVALTLLNLREVARQPEAKQRRADTLLAPDYITVLSHWRYNQTRPAMTVYEFCLALARLGGHQNRKGDGHPGWLTLWRGWTKLQAMLDGFDAAQHNKCGQT
jgi:hypothetical protein